MPHWSACAARTEIREALLTLTIGARAPQFNPHQQTSPQDSSIIMRLALLFAAAVSQIAGFVPHGVPLNVRALKPSTALSMVTTDDDDEVKVTVRIKKPPPKNAGPPAAASTLAIEAAFVQAASGMSGADYEFGLMEFVRATREAYDEGTMVPALNLALASCQQYTAGRPLQSDEIELRTVWLSLVYLTFERVGYESMSAGAFLGQSVAEDLRQKFYTFTVRHKPSPTLLGMPPPTLIMLQPQPSPAAVRHRQREEARLRLGGAEARGSAPERGGEDAHGASGPQPGHANLLPGHPGNRGGLTC